VGKITKWRSTLRESYVLQCNVYPVTSTTYLQQAIIGTKDEYTETMFSTMEKQALHPQSGVPQLYFDQMHHIDQHLFHLNTDPDWQTDAHHEDGPIYPSLRIKASKQRQAVPPKSKHCGTKLTRRNLLLRDEWSAWQHSECLQLDQYDTQHTFGTPCSPPTNANIFHLLWTYTINDCDTKEAGYV